MLSLNPARIPDFVEPHGECFLRLVDQGMLGLPLVQWLEGGGARIHLLVSPPAAAPKGPRGIPVAVPVEVPCMGPTSLVAQVESNGDVRSYYLEDGRLYVHSREEDERLRQGTDIAPLAGLAAAMVGVTRRGVSQSAVNHIEGFNRRRTPAPVKLVHVQDLKESFRPAALGPNQDGPLGAARVEIQAFVRDRYRHLGGRVLVRTDHAPHFVLSVTDHGNVDIDERSSSHFDPHPYGRRLYAYIDVTDLAAATAMATRIAACRPGAKVRSRHTLLPGSKGIEYASLKVRSLEAHAASFVQASRRVAHHLPPATLEPLAALRGRLDTAHMLKDPKALLQSLRAAWEPVSWAMGDTQGLCLAHGPGKPDAGNMLRLHVARSVLDLGFKVSPPAGPRRATKPETPQHVPTFDPASLERTLHEMRVLVSEGGRVFAEAWQEAMRARAAYALHRDAASTEALIEALNVLAFTAPEDFWSQEHALAWAMSHRRSLRMSVLALRQPAASRGNAIRGH